VESDLNFDASLEQPLVVEPARPPRRRARATSAWSGDVAGGILVLLDFFSVLSAGFLADVFDALGGGYRLRSRLAGSLICGIAVLQVNQQFKLYDPTLARRTLPMIDRLLTALILAFAYVAIVAYLIDAPVTYPSAWKLRLFILSFAFLTSGRLFFNHVVAKLAERRILSRNIVIVGAGAHGQMLIDQLERSGFPWTRILCIFDDRARSAEARTPKRIKGRYPVLGTTQDLVDFSRKFRVDDVFIALPWSAETRINQVLNVLQVIPANIHLFPDALRLSLSNRSLTAMDGMPVVTMMAKPVSGWGYLAKWVLDKLLAIVALVLLTPLLLLVALAIKLDSKGPVFFRQPRLGFNNKIMRIYKFRSMYHEQADMVADQLATRNDPRVTSLGRVLRKLSIDELPQLLNVIRGDMSLVGPRPHALKAKAAGHLYHEIVSGYALRHKIKPGITGWAQVSGWRGETDTEEKIIRRVECDLFYMNNWSVLFDFYILLMTVLKVPFHKNAY
jgi:Undecaprenyl-phosphate glucose phosphotransferase